MTFGLLEACLQNPTATAEDAVFLIFLFLFFLRNLLVSDGEGKRFSMGGIEGEDGNAKDFLSLLYATYLSLTL